jgi:tetratricopeptide (TPR) repeat protein
MASQPQSEPMGYETALSIGTTALERGYSAAALAYLERAVALRPGRYALVQLAKAQRDQGLFAEARATLLAARQLPDGEDPYVRVTLAAILCDLGEYGDALTVALEAWQEKPQDAPTLSVLARTMRELCGALSKHEHIDHSVIEYARGIAAELEAQAQAARPAEELSASERRRRRAQGHFAPPPIGSQESWAPLEQEPGRPLGEVGSSTSIADDAADATGGESPPEKPPQRASWWWRALHSFGLGRRRG